MKELSIEEKAKAYDKAIKRAKEKYAMFEGTKQGDVLEDVFPELKESEDEMIRNQIIEHIKWSYDEQECAEEEMHRWISWLEKQGEQKHAWSEEDEVKINRIVACLENLNVADNDILLKDVAWLKSLRPQNRWKPSDEQMEALDSATENCAYSEYQDCLRELIKQLKKLK